jgi:uncharacterized protein YacL
MRQQDIFQVGARFVRESGFRSNKARKGDVVLLDTSVIIDGRIADVSRTGFIGETMLVPRFVLNELQHIADSSDSLRRNRGRRGLDMLNKLQKESVVPIRITDMDMNEVREVDDKLVMLAKQLHCPIITNDYNLNRVAELQGVMVLNVNELANAVKVIFLPGETMQVLIIQEGKEAGQGVGYLDDGTMVVVENGRRHINRTIDATVTKVLQTAAPSTKGSWDCMSVARPSMDTLTLGMRKRTSPLIYCAATWSTWDIGFVTCRTSPTWATLRTMPMQARTRLPRRREVSALSRWRS